MHISGYNVNIYDNYMNLTPGITIDPRLNQVVTSIRNDPVLEAYNAFRNYGNNSRAQAMEQSNSIISIKMDNLADNMDSKTVKNNNNYVITLNSNISQANNFYQAKTILDASYGTIPIKFFPDSSDKGIIYAYDMAAILGDGISIFLPFAAPYGYKVSAFASVNGYLETVYRYKIGRADVWDLAVSGFTTVTGFIP